ncbi:MAG: hypothetical protein U0U70_05730 [Chitinophagaceae bacterium]
MISLVLVILIWCLFKINFKSSFISEDYFVLGNSGTKKGFAACIRVYIKSHYNTMSRDFACLYGDFQAAIAVSIKRQEAPEKEYTVPDQQTLMIQAGCSTPYRGVKLLQGKDQPVVQREH